MTLRFVYYSCLLLSAVLAVINRKTLKSRQLTIFIPYLWLVLAQELSVYYYISNYPAPSTGIIYNVYRLVSTCVFGVFFYNIPLMAPARRLVLVLLGLYLAVYAITFGLIHSIFMYNSYLSMASGLVINICAIFFLFNYFNLDNRTEEKTWQPVIWVTIGVAVYYPVVNVSFAFYKYIVAYEATIFGLMLYNAIPRLMSIFMYGCFAYAFHLCKKRN